MIHFIPQDSGRDETSLAFYWMMYDAPEIGHKRQLYNIRVQRWTRHKKRLELGQISNWLHIVGWGTWLGPTQSNSAFCFDFSSHPGEISWRSNHNLSPMPLPSDASSCGSCFLDVLASSWAFFLQLQPYQLQRGKCWCTQKRGRFNYNARHYRRTPALEKCMPLVNGNIIWCILLKPNFHSFCTLLVLFNRGMSGDIWWAFLGAFWG